MILEAAGVRSPSREARARHRDASPSANGAAGAGCGRGAAGEAQALDHSGDGAGLRREVVASSLPAGRVGVRRALHRTKSNWPPTPDELERGGSALLAELFGGLSLSGDAAGPASPEAPRSSHAPPSASSSSGRRASVSLDPAAAGALQAGSAGATRTATRGRGGSGALDFVPASTSSAQPTRAKSAAAGKASATAEPRRSSGGRSGRGRGSVGSPPLPPPRAPLAVESLSFDDVRLAGNRRVVRYLVQADEGASLAPSILSEGTLLQRVTTDGDGACALHAAFGGLLRSSLCFCPDARERAADALESLAANAATDCFGSNLAQGFPAFGSVKAQFWMLALSACRSHQDEGRECGLLWDAFPVEVQQEVRNAQAGYEQVLASQEAAMARFEHLSKMICVSSPHGRALVQRIALEVHGLDVTHLPDDLERLCDAELHAWLGPAFDNLGGEVIVKGTAANPVVFPMDGPANKYVALFDERPVFDYFRRAFFITGYGFKQVQIIEILCESQELRDDADVCSLLDTLLVESQNMAGTPDAFVGFDVVAVVAFARACRAPGYWFSFDEVLFLAEVLGEAVVVVELFGDHVARCVGSSVLPAGKPVAIIGVDSNRVRRVRSHFSRLVVVPGEHADARPGREQRGGLLKRRRRDQRA